ncbi:MAG: glucokinase [Clostridiales bacterium]|nr:MAG: glucokinase [Clostridiales bacterium]
MSYTAGIDLGGTNIAVGIVDEAFRIVSRAKRKTALPRSGEAILQDAVDAVREAVEAAGVGLDQIDWVGIGSPGIVNREAGCVDYSCNLDFYGQDLREFLTNALQKPIYMDNDANCAAYGEFVAGGAKGVSDAVAITLGTGIGGGIIIDKKIYSGFNFAGAEIGHTVIQMGGRPCTCGRRGCFEAYASATGLIRSTREAMEAHPESEMWALCGGDSAKADGHTAFDGMRAGDEAAAEVVRDYIEALACGVTDIINTFAPEILCIGGGISKEGDTLIAPLSEIVHREMYSRFSKRQTRIVTAELGNDAGIIGAAALGLQYC